MAVQNQRLQRNNNTNNSTTAPEASASASSSSAAAAALAPNSIGTIKASTKMPTTAHVQPLYGNQSNDQPIAQPSYTSSSSYQPMDQHNHHHHYSHHHNHNGHQAQIPPPAPATTATNGGPRVSFNRDVHVKRIGKHPNELTNYETTNLQPPQTIPYHQLPADISVEDIRKEAALVLAQAERHKSKAENADNIPIFRVKTKNPKKFHSLPTRKKKSPAGKPVTRSVSDAAAAKKPSKRPSIFSLFSRKSDSNVAQVDRDPRFEDSGGRRLVRSKSDVGSYDKDERKVLKKTLKDSKQTSNGGGSGGGGGGSSKQLPTQLSPIIENAQKEDYFEEQFNRERRKSEAITDREKHESGLSEFIERSRSKAEVDGNLIGKNPISGTIKDKIRTLQAKSNEKMHSSQMPAEKLPLTKGRTVNGLVKRLSMERFSPPPPLSQPAFSYIRPNEGITYAQLDLSDDQQHHHQPHKRTLERLRSPSREIRTPIRDYKSPLREIRSPDRELLRLNRQSVDRTDFSTSQQNLKNHAYSAAYNGVGGSSSRVIIESPTTKHDVYPPVVGPTTIRISSSHSPSPWQQLSPRNLSDEDEGLGIETRKYYDDDIPKMSGKSIAEPPIIPVIRSITPTRENGYDSRDYHRSPNRDDPVDDLGYRRARLESRILTRRFGESATLDRNGYHDHDHEHVQNLHHASSSPERNRSVLEESTINHRYLSPEREAEFEPRFHKLDSKEILNKYSPERSHLDIISPSATTLPKSEKTSRYKHTKYYDDGLGGVKEVYERETLTDRDGQPHVRESRHRERLDSYGNGGNKREHHSSMERQLTDYEPKSLDSQFTSTDQYRSSPENMKRYENGSQQRSSGEEQHWHSSLKRDKLQQRSFDKGDSGIENDFRKESFNGDISSRWRKRSTFDDIKACETFLKKERRHSEHQHPAARRKDNYVYRERSIDDGSHFDPHLDKYPVATSTLRRRDQQSQTQTTGHHQRGGEDATIKRSKKLGGFEKVKQLFIGGGGGGGSAAEKKESSERQARATSSTTTTTTTTTSSSSQNRNTLPGSAKDKKSGKENGHGKEMGKDKDRYMVREEEMRSRYREYRATLPNEKAPDISMRRRLSTPKASPLLLKRTSSDKTKKESPLAKPEKLSWFKSLDRRARSKSKEKITATVNGQSETSTMKRNGKSARPPGAPAKNLRFFGDTDLDSNPPTVSRASSTLKTRPTLSSSLNRSQKYSQSAYHLDRINESPLQQDYRQNLSSSSSHSVGGSRHKSTSMQNLENGHIDEVDFRKRRHYSRSRELHDISESGSETEEQQKRPNGIGGGGGGGGGSGARTLSRERLDRTHRYDDNSHRRSSDRQTAMNASAMNGVGGRSSHHPLVGPPKPARSAERRILSSLSRERDRFPAESSGTEGESSLHSQRSIVYLHATTVGAIPQPYHMRRRSISRDDLRSQKSSSKQSPQPIQPMTRTVSRSVSMLAPWKPKFAHEGYEINYSQEQNKKMTTMPRKVPPHHGSSSTLTRASKKSETPSSRTRRQGHDHLKDDQSSMRNSSTTSASKSALSANLRRKIK